MERNHGSYFAGEMLRAPNYVYHHAEHEERHGAGCLSSRPWAVVAINATSLAPGPAGRILLSLPSWLLLWGFRDPYPYSATR
jgi:hypothetical protein